MDQNKRPDVKMEKFLSFCLGEEDFCFAIQSVQEIIALPEITTIPQIPGFIKGVINLRGRIMPVIDLHEKFGGERESYGKRTCVIVISFYYDGTESILGIIVDETQEVIMVPENNMSQVPYVNAQIKSEYIKGVIEHQKKIKIILDINNILGDQDFTIFGNILENTEE